MKIGFALSFFKAVSSSVTASPRHLLPFRLNGRGVSFAGSLLPLPCGVTRHSKTIINCFRTAYPLGKAFEVGTFCG